MKFMPTDNSPIDITDNFKLGATFYISDGEKFQISGVTSVTIHSESQSANFIPIGASVIASIENSKRHLVLHASSIFIKSSKQKRIELAAHYIDRATIQNRVKMLADKLNKSGSLTIKDFNERDVVITNDGRIQQGTTELLISEIKREGAYKIGMENDSISGLSYESQPNQVVITDSRNKPIYTSGWIGEAKRFHSRGNVIHFTPYSNTSAYHALLHYVLR